MRHSSDIILTSCVQAWIATPTPLSPTSYLLSSEIWAEIDTETKLVVDYLARYEEEDKPNVVKLVFNDEELCK